MALVLIEGFIAFVDHLSCFRVNNLLPITIVLAIRSAYDLIDPLVKSCYEPFDASTTIYYSWSDNRVGPKAVMRGARV